MATLSAGVTARLVNRFGPKPVMYPAMFLAAGGLAPAWLRPASMRSTSRRIFFAMLMLGVGAGASFMPLLQIGMSEIPNADAGLGSGVVNVSQQMAGAIGLAVLSTVATNRTRSLVASGHGLVHSLTLGYQLALYVAAGMRPAGPGPGTDPLADQGITRRGSGAHRREHAEPRDLRAPRPVKTRHRPAQSCLPT